MYNTCKILEQKGIVKAHQSKFIYASIDWHIQYRTVVLSDKPTISINFYLNS